MGRNLKRFTGFMMHHKEEKSSKGKEVTRLTVKILSAKLKSSRLERQLLMQNQMRERQTAMQIAWTREFLKYFGTFFGLAAVGLTAGAIKKKNPGVLLPIVPLSFIFAYQYDMGYGTLLQRIKDVFIPALPKAFCTLQLLPAMLLRLHV
ncbi:plasminogen receptor (KT) isoform X2 [Aquila chrysaetos chrysaetos]|uniref:plasminogen receptor (KT) isoform X2 n=1 Tax=Aquila chrysaetos chrysaetos TaxID=223781 RepID=UPI0011769D0F|nr:plasminogen receptor (KT) isoform X2 [Aquila chrysaetos chrysaetos]